MKLNKILLIFNPGRPETFIGSAIDYRKEVYATATWADEYPDAMFIVGPDRSVLDKIKGIADNFVALGESEIPCVWLCYITDEEALALKLLEIA